MNVYLNELVDRINVYVSGFYNDDYAKEVADSLLNQYDFAKVLYAIESNMDLFDLDRWEFAAKLHSDCKLKGMLSHIGFDYTDEKLNEYIADGEKFFKKIVNPLWELDYEIMELESYQNLEFMKVEYKKNKEIYIERMHEGTTIGCQFSTEDVAEAIVEEYQANDVPIGEILSSISIQGLSVEDVVTVYAKVYERIVGGKVIRLTCGEQINIAEGKTIEISLDTLYNQNDMLGIIQLYNNTDTQIIKQNIVKYINRKNNGLGYFQGDFAKDLGVSVDTIRSWCKVGSPNKPYFERALKLADILGISVMEFIKEVERNE